jgi:hypothetical protein
VPLASDARGRARFPPPENWAFKSDLLRKGLYLFESVAVTEGFY